MIFTVGLMVWKNYLLLNELILNISKDINPVDSVEHKKLKEKQYVSLIHARE